MAPTAPTTAAAQAEVLTSLVQATVLGPLVAELAVSRQTVERQAERLAAQAETIGTLRAERDAAQASILVAQPTLAPVEPAVTV